MDREFERKIDRLSDSITDNLDDLKKIISEQYDLIESKDTEIGELKNQIEALEKQLEGEEV